MVVYHNLHRRLGNRLAYSVQGNPSQHVMEGPYKKRDTAAMYCICGLEAKHRVEAKPWIVDNVRNAYYAYIPESRAV